MAELPEDDWERDQRLAEERPVVRPLTPRQAPWEEHASRRLDRLEQQTKWLAVAVVVEAIALMVILVGNVRLFG